MAVDVSSYYGVSATDRGTKISNSSDSLDKTAFLQILVAELSNLDPTGDVDSTQYVTQLAQYASMEQMSNLNTTMSNNAAYELVGKGVVLNSYDSEGNAYSGIVRAVTGSNGSNYTVSVETYENGQSVYFDVPLSSISAILDTASDETSIGYLSTLNTNSAMMNATAYIGKYVKVSDKDDDGNTIEATGKVLSVVKNDGSVYVKVQDDTTGEVNEYEYSTIYKVQDEPITD